MSTPAQQPQDDWAPDPAWPVQAVPQKWVERLFATMSATYGARFADLWRVSDISQVKRQWGIELAKLTASQIKAGRENLMDLVRSPTLPEFIAHCRQSRADVVAHTTQQLVHEPRTTPEQAAAGKAMVRNAIRSLRMDQPSADWAFRMLLNGAQRSHEALRCARDAVTSPAGKEAVEACETPEKREQYRALRQRVIDDYRMRGIRLWSVA